MEFAALILLHIFSATVIAVAAKSALRRRRLYAFLLGGLLGYQLLMTLTLGSLVDEFGIKTVFIGELVILLGCASLLLSISFFERITGSIAATRSANPVLEAASQWRQYLVVVLICLSIITVIAARRGELLLANWEEFRAQSSFVDSIAQLLQFLVFPAAWIAFRAGKRAWAIAFVLVAVGMFPVLGSRAALLTLPAVVALDLLRSDITRRRIYGVLGATAAAALVLHIVGRAVRGLGLGGLFRLVSGEADGAEVVREAYENMEWTGGETDIARYYTFVVDQGNFPDMTPLVSVLRWIMFYVPRSVFQELKPEDGTYVLWRHAANGGMFDALPSLDQMLELLRIGDPGSLHPTLWGEFWFNGGWAAIPIAALVLGLLVVGIERSMERLPSLSAALIAPATAVGYLMVARGNSVIGLGYFFYLFPVALALSLVSGAICSVSRRKTVI